MTVGRCETWKGRNRGIWREECRRWVGAAAREPPEGDGAIWRDFNERALSWCRGGWRVSADQGAEQDRSNRRGEERRGEERRGEERVTCVPRGVRRT
jgi:hypothetical protein